MINRRKFFEKTIKSGIAAGLTFPAVNLIADDQTDNNIPAGQSEAAKPDIIFFQTDQQRWDALGILNSHIKTPNLDMLARNGITYRQATCQ